MIARAGLPLQDMEFVQFHPTGIYGAGVLITRGCAGRRRLPDQLGRRAFHGALRSDPPRTWPPGMLYSRSMTIEIREGRGVGPEQDHCHLHLDHLPEAVLAERLPGITESARIFANVDLTRDPIPVLPTVPLQHGRYSLQLLGRSDRTARGEPGTRLVPGLMAVGEAACVSVHGANRLGSNSPHGPHRVRTRRGHPGRTDHRTGLSATRLEQQGSRPDSGPFRYDPTRWRRNADSQHPPRNATRHAG